MNESSHSWVAILILYNESDAKRNQKESEPYILSKKEATYIGRSPDCHFILSPEYSTVSRYHAKFELVKQDGEVVWQVQDLGTPNGTFVNNQRIKDFKYLKSGDCITLGKTNGANFRFEWKFIEVEELNDVFRKKRLYNETVIPDAQELESLNEGKTQFFDQNAPQEKFQDRQEDNIYAELKQVGSEIKQNITDSKLNVEHNNDAKIFTKRWPYLMLALLTFLALSFLIYRNQDIFSTKEDRDEGLRAYIENISRLLLNNKLSSLNPYDPDARKARDSANGQTLIELKNLDGQEKGTLLRFLHGTNLIKIQPQKLTKEWFSNTYTNSNKSKLQISNLDLSRKELFYLRLNRTEKLKASALPFFLMNQTEFNRKYNKKTEKCDFDRVDRDILVCALVLPFKVQAYEKPIVTPIQLSGSDLTGVVLKDAPLEDINLEGAYVSFKECKQNLSGNFVEDNFYRRPIDWLSRYKCRADFSGAGLQGARLFQSVLMGANLSNAKLDDADLRQADLRWVNLTGATLTGATLTGACYIKEEWKKNFPKTGSNGQPFNPDAEGMIAIAIRQSNIHDPLNFQECKNFSATQPDPSR
ncbi:pentapeptide repeat-containing protein [Altericista sp. CCNU0014]|uniref:pentapeptide repeat-containing protein n=1 Tax=Altericista sp. CCNU0014 TaxID=3082949 RepID=UPI00384F273D